MKKRERYKRNKVAKVGAKIVCPSCGTEFIKTQHQQAFCKSLGGTICKDKYWNTVTPEKRCNTTRISPANRAYQARWKDSHNDDSPTYDGEEYDVFSDMNV